MKTHAAFLTLLGVLAVLPLVRAEGAAKPAVPAHISHGSEINLKDQLVAGKTTIFDFYSDYCPPCRELAPQLEKLHRARADLAVVKVDINRPGTKGIDWRSPVARQYDLNSIPHLVIFGPDGRKLAEGDEAWAMVDRWLGQL